MLEVFIFIWIIATFGLFVLAGSMSSKKNKIVLYLVGLFFITVLGWMNYRSEYKLEEFMNENAIFMTEIRLLFANPEIVQLMNDYNKEPTTKKWATVVQSVERTKELDKDPAIEEVEALIKRLHKLGLLSPPPTSLETIPD